MTRRASGRVLGAALSLVLLASACGSDDTENVATDVGDAADNDTDTDTDTDADTPDDVKELTVGTSTSITLHSLPALAVDQGFDADNGLDLSIQEFPSGSAMVEAVAAGDIRVAQAGDVPFLSLAAGGVPVRLVSELTDSGANYTFYMAADQAPEEPEDIEGKRIGLPFGSTSSIVMEQFIATYGLDGSSIELIDLAPGAIAPAYASGEIDGFILWSPGSNRAAAERESVLIHDAYMSYLPCCEGPEKLGSAHTVVFALQDVLDSDPDLVERYMRTLLDAQEFLTNPSTSDEAISIIAGELDVEEELVATALEQIEYPLTLDEPLLEDLGSTANYLVSSGSVTSEPDLDSLVATEPLQAVAPDRVDL